MFRARWPPRPRASRATVGHGRHRSVLAAPASETHCCHSSTSGPARATFPIPHPLLEHRGSKGGQFPAGTAVSLSGSHPTTGGRHPVNTDRGNATLWLHAIQLQRSPLSPSKRASTDGRAAPRLFLPPARDPFDPPGSASTQAPPMGDRPGLWRGPLPAAIESRRATRAKLTSLAPDEAQHA